MGHEKLKEAEWLKNLEQGTKEHQKPKEVDVELSNGSLSAVVSVKIGKTPGSLIPDAKPLTDDGTPGTLPLKAKKRWRIWTKADVQLLNNISKGAKQAELTLPGLNDLGNLVIITLQVPICW